MNILINSIEHCEYEKLYNLMQVIFSQTNNMLMDVEDISSYSIDTFTHQLNMKLTESVCYIAIDSNKYIGYAMAIRSTDKRHNHCATLVVAVEKSYWGKGIASKLIDTVILWCNENNVYRLEANVRSDNKTAISLYNNKGFNAEGNRKNSFKACNKFFNEILLVKFTD